MTKTGDARPKAAKCQAIARSGSRCSSSVLTGSAFCFVHDPAAAEARRDASRKGGFARSNKARAQKQIPEAMSAGDLAGWLSALFRAVISGRVEPRVGTACATIAKTLLDVRAATELEERLTELEALANRGTNRRGTR